MGNLNCRLVSDEREMKTAFQVRRRVFVDEQGVSENLVFDGCDREAMHMVVEDGEEIIGTARIRFLPDNQAKLERMAVLASFRGKGIGRMVISFLDQELRNRQVEQLVLHAQYEAVAFYKSCGFEETGVPFWEADIKHIKMQKKL